LRADIVAASYRAQRFTVHVAALDRFALPLSKPHNFVAVRVALWALSPGKFAGEDGAVTVARQSCEGPLPLGCEPPNFVRLAKS
jgi:hypothetical protein